MLIAVLSSLWALRRAERQRPRARALPGPDPRPGQPLQVVIIQGLGIEPEAGEDRERNTPSGRGQLLEVTAAADEPVNAIGVELDDEVFQHTRPFVVGLFRPQVIGTAGASDLDDQLGSTGDVTFDELRLSSQLLGDPQLAVRLGLAILLQESWSRSSC